MSSALFPIHLSFEVTEFLRDLDLLLICRQIPTPDCKSAQGWRWTEVAVFNHTTSGSPAKAVYFMI